MPQTVANTVKSLTAPILFAATLGLCGWTWATQQHRIDELESQSAAYAQTLATISENQRLSAADRSAFQDATTQRLDKMQDILTTVGESLSALSALNQRQERDLGRGQ